MQILNLKSGFEPYGAATLHLAKSRIFAGGETDILLQETILTADNEVIVTTRVNRNDDLVELLMTTDALREIGYEHIHVFIPYLPYARQDRIVRSGEAFSLRVVARIINLQKYASVRVFEAHSDVAEKLIDRLESIPNTGFVASVLGGQRDFWILYPDKGAFARYGSGFGAAGIGGETCVCGKERSLKDGSILETKIPAADFGSKDVYIIDDICDGGRTFIALAREIRRRNAGKINLIVSHGIFSHGEEPLKQGGIDHVFTTDSFKPVDSPYVTQVHLCDILMPITTHA